MQYALFSMRNEQYVYRLLILSFDRSALEEWSWHLEMGRLFVRTPLMLDWMLCSVKNFQRYVYFSTIPYCVTGVGANYITNY